MSPTGRKLVQDVYFKNVHIICLDQWQRLPFNFAVSLHGTYREFTNVASAKRYIRGAA
jgi:hypothetical protein